MAGLNKLYVAAAIAAITAFPGVNRDASAYLYNSWNAVTPMADTTADPSGLASNLNIDSFRIAKDGTSTYFRMDINSGTAAPDAAYGFILTGGGVGEATAHNGKFNQYLLWNTNGSISSTGHDNGLFLRSTADNKMILEWKLDNKDLASSYTYFAATYTHPNGKFTDLTLKDSTQNVAVTPIPAAAWLLGSGVLGLVGIRRKSKRGFAA